MMMTLQELCMRKIVEAELPRDDLPQILQMDLKYFPGIRFNREGYPVFEHINGVYVKLFFETYDDENVWGDPFPEALRDRWTRDLTAADLRHHTYMQTSDTSRLMDIVDALAWLGYDDYEFMEEMIVEVLSRNITISSKKHFLQKIFIDYFYEYDGKLSMIEILYHLQHRTDKETLMRVRDVMVDILQVMRDIESDDYV